MLELRTTDAQTTLIALLELTRDLGVTLSGLGSAQATLEDVFLARTGRQYEDVPETPSEEPAAGRRGRRRRG
jgi:hypothetical protein